MPTPTAAHTQLLLLILLNAAALAGDTIFWIRFVRKMKGFDWFVSQALYPLSAALLLWPVIAGLHFTHNLSPRNWNFPKRYILILAALGSGTNWGLTIAATLLPEQLVTVVMRLTTVFVIVQSAMILGTRYRWTHILGASIVAVAAVIDVEFGSGEAKSPHNHTVNGTGAGGSGGGGGGLSVVGLLMLVIICCNPKSVLTEKFTKTHLLHPAFLRGMEALLTVGMGVILSPLAFVQTSQEQAPVPMTGAGITSYLSAACGCFAGYPQNETHPEADCEGAWIVYLAFIACNLTYDTTSIAIGKRGSAAIGCVGSSLSLVLTVVLTQVPWLTGLGEPAPLNVATGISVVLVIVGLVLYSMRPEMPREEYATEITGGGGGGGGGGGAGKSWEEKMIQERLMPEVVAQ